MKRLTMDLTTAKKEIFKNMLRKGLSKELAQECAGIDDELAEKILAEL